MRDIQATSPQDTSNDAQESESEQLLLQATGNDTLSMWIESLHTTEDLVLKAYEPLLRSFKETDCGIKIVEQQGKVLWTSCLWHYEPSVILFQLERVKKGWSPVVVYSLTGYI